MKRIDMFVIVAAVLLVSSSVLASALQLPARGEDVPEFWFTRKKDAVSVDLRSAKDRRAALADPFRIAAAIHQAHRDLGCSNFDISEAGLAYEIAGHAVLAELFLKVDSALDKLERHISLDHPLGRGLRRLLASLYESASVADCSVDRYDHNSKPVQLIAVLYYDLCTEMSESRPAADWEFYR